MNNKYNEEFFRMYEQKYIRNENVQQKTEIPSGESRRKPRYKKRCLKAKFVIRRTAVLLLVAAIAVTVCAALIRKSTKTDKQNTLITQPPVTDTVPDDAADKAVLGYAQNVPDTATLANEIDSEYAVFVRVSDNTVIAEKNSDTKIYPASLTKVLTLLVAVENIKNFDDTFTFTSELIDPAYIAGASMAGFSPGESVPVRDLLYGAVLPSGADATAALAVYVAGSEDKFVELMNRKAEELGLDSAHFCNTSGLHDENHYCTVKDMAVIFNTAMQNSACKEVLSTYQYTTTKTSKHPQGILLTSTLFSRMKGDEPGSAVITAGKTGFTSEAGNCIASFGTSQNGNDYIFVTAKAHGFWKSVFDHINIYKAYAK